MRLPALTFITAFIAIGSAAAQTATLPYDHVHLAAPDQAKAVEWYQKNFGGETTPEGKDRLLFGKTRFIWLKSETAQPSADTAIDHIAFSLPDRTPGLHSGSVGRDDRNPERSRLARLPPRPSELDGSGRVAGVVRAALRRRTREVQGRRRAEIRRRPRARTESQDGADVRASATHSITSAGA